MYILQDFKQINMFKLIIYLIIGTRERAVFLFRLSSWCYKHKLKVLAKVFYSLNIALHSCDIAPSADIGSGLKMFHTVGIVVGAITAGKNLHLFQNITIGDKNHLLPKIGDNVTLYSGVAVIGDIFVGDNVKVGANSVVLQDLPNECTAVGSPCKIIKFN